MQIDLKNKQNSDDVTRITNQINHSNFKPSQFTNEMFADLIRFFEEKCITKTEIAKLICKVVMIDETWMDQPEFIKSFVTKYIHKNFILSFKKKMENKKLDLCSQFQRVTDLSEGGVHYSVKYLDPSPPSYIAVPSQKFGKTDEKQDLCANCNVSSNIKTLYFCNNCRVTKYCGVLCLVADYGKHNMYCEKIAQTTIKHPVDIDINIYNVSQIINKTLETHQIQTLKQDKLIQQLSDKNKNLTTKLREQTRLKSKSEETTSPSVIYRENDISGRKDIFIGKSVTMNKTYRSVYCKIKKNCDVKKNNLIKRGELKNRADKLFNIITIVSGEDNYSGKEEQNDNLSIVLLELIRKYPNVFKKALNDPLLLKETRQLTPSQSSMFMQKVCLTYGSRRRAVSMLMKSQHYNMLGSEKKQRKFEKETLEFLNCEDNVEFGNMLLKKTAQSKSSTQEAYVRVKSITKYSEYILNEAVRSGKLDFNSSDFKERMKNKIWFVQSADHGGNMQVSSSMKYNLQILDFEIYPYGIYEGSDCHENQKIFHEPFKSEFKDLVDNGICYNSQHFEVLLFSKGDMKQAFETMGLGGAASSYPSRYSLVTLDHLRKKHADGSPHGPTTCGTPEIRSMAGINEMYHKNRADKRNYNNLQKNARWYQSVINRCLILLQEVYMSVPNILHYKLGLVLAGIVEQRHRLRKNQSKASQELLDRKTRACLIHITTLEAKNKERIFLSERILKCQGLLKRLYSWPNIMQLEAIAKNENSDLKVEDDFNKWIFPYSCRDCILTKYDEASKYNWKECDTCGKHFHLFCLAESEEETTSKFALTIVQCSTCSNRCHEQTIEALVKEAFLLESESEIIENDISKLKQKCDSLGDEIHMYTTSEEVKFNQKLRDLNVDIQVRHGGSIIGNHCEIILDNFTDLVDILPIEEDKILFRDYYKTITNIIRPCQAKRWLSEKEISDIKMNCIELGKLWPKIRSSGVTVKVDDIVYHVPIFLKKFGTLGLLSEEDTEVIHKEMNEILRPLSSIRQRGTKLFYGFKRLALKKKNNERDSEFATPTSREFKNRDPKFKRRKLTSSYPECN